MTKMTRMALSKYLGWGRGGGGGGGSKSLNFSGQNGVKLRTMKEKNG